MNELALVNTLTGEYIAADEDPVQAGAVAWQKIDAEENDRREKWLIVGAGLKELQNRCISGTGNVDNKKFGALCQEYGYTMDNRIRSDAIWLHENAESVFQSLEDTITHPVAIRQQWRKIEKQNKKLAQNDAEVNALEAPIADYEIICGDFRSISVCLADVIITDPPYPKEYLPLYADLADFATQTLKPGGLLVVMCGQSWLPQIIKDMSEKIDYLWIAAYLTPGGQAVQVFPRKVNTFWKPLLIFSNGEYSGDWYGDVCRSDTNDNDKEHHHWGQSESGMYDIVKRFSNPGDMIVDPFCGAGTTGIVSVQMDRKFIGIDIDAQHVETAIGRFKCLK